MKLLVLLLLFVIYWPAALLALVLYPVLFVVLLPFRIVGMAVHGVLALVAAVFLLPVRLLQSHSGRKFRLLHRNAKMGMLA